MAFVYPCFSERAHEKELERIRRRSQMRDDVINEAINKVKQEQQEIEEQRLKQAENVRLQKDAEDERCVLRLGVGLFISSITNTVTRDLSWP